MGKTSSMSCVRSLIHASRLRFSPSDLHKCSQLFDLEGCTLVHLRLLTCTNAHSLQPKERPGSPVSPERRAHLFLFYRRLPHQNYEKSVDILAQVNNFAKGLAAPPLLNGC